MIRFVRLAIYIAIGAVLGALIGKLALIPFAAVVHVGKDLAATASLVGASLGAIVGAIRWRNMAAGSSPSTVHGSAQFAAPRT